MKNLPHMLKSGFHYVGNGDKDILKILFLVYFLNQQISCWNVIIQEVTNSKSESQRNMNWISPCKAQGHETIWEHSTVQRQIPCQYGQEIHKLLVKREAARTAAEMLLFYTGWCSKSLTVSEEGKKQTQRSSWTEGIAYNNNLFLKHFCSLLTAWILFSDFQS